MAREADGKSWIVATENLTKTYGRRTVVSELDLRIPEGCVYGFLGPNGSGNSTTMKMLLSLIRPTSGQVHVMGRPMDRSTRRELLGSIGSLIESPPRYAHLTGGENMRIVDIEHQGGGWLLSAASGTTPGVLCRAKLAVLGTALVAVLCMLSPGTAAAGLALGISAPWPAGRWIGATVCLIVVDLVLVALHLLLSARVENQLVGLGIGLLGMIIALVAPMLPVAIQHLVPRGYFALSEAAGYVGSEIEPLRPAYPSIAALGVLAAVLFGLTTRSFDRREA